RRSVVRRPRGLRSWLPRYPVARAMPLAGWTLRDPRGRGPVRPSTRRLPRARKGNRDGAGAGMGQTGPMPADSSGPGRTGDGVPAHLPGDPERSVLELARGEQHWLRARLLPEGLYELRCRDGPGADRFELFSSDHVLVRDILFAWLDEDPWWRDAVAWSPIDPAISEIEAVRDELADLLG